MAPVGAQEVRGGLAPGLVEVGGHQHRVLELPHLHGAAGRHEAGALLGVAQAGLGGGHDGEGVGVVARDVVLVHTEHHYPQQTCRVLGRVLEHDRGRLGVDPGGIDALGQREAHGVGGRGVVEDLPLLGQARFGQVEHELGLGDPHVGVRLGDLGGGHGLDGDLRAHVRPPGGGAAALGDEVLQDGREPGGRGHRQRRLRSA